MTLGERMRRVREYRRLKQIAVASQMNITQQAYSELESRGENVKLETLRRFCAVVNIDLAFLLSYEIQVTEENIMFFDRNKLVDVVKDYARLRNKLDVYEEIMSRSKTKEVY